MQLGQEAPDFKLKDQYGAEQAIRDYRGQWVLLCFYPKDDAEDCSEDACEMRDNYAEFEDNGLAVIGVTRDSVASVKKFAEKNNLPFSILADEQTSVAKAYDAFGDKSYKGKEFKGVFRKSYLINPKGKVKKLYEKVRPEAHAKQILEDIEMYNKRAEDTKA